MRFPEFTGEWEKKKLGEIVERVTRKNRNLETMLPLTISAQYGLINQGSFFNKTIASANLSHYYLLYKGEFAYNKSYSGDYPWGAIKRLDLYDKGALSTLYICFKPKDSKKSDFLMHYFESPKWHNEISNIAGEGARNHGLLNIAVSNFFNTMHYVSKSTDEQQKIATFLSLIDERIKTQNKIIEELKKLKTALVDKFLKPKIYWKKVRLSNCCSIRNGLSLIQNDSQIGYLVTRIETISHRYIDLNKVGYLETSIDISKYKLNEGDILFSNINSVSHIGKTAFVDKKYNLYHGMNLLRLVTDRSILNPYFLFLILNTPKSINKFQSICNQAVSQASINQTELGKFSFSAPPLSEQNTIAEFFKKIEKSIFLETRKLSCYKKQKLFLMREMFI